MSRAEKLAAVVLAVLALAAAGALALRAMIHVTGVMQGGVELAAETDGDGAGSKRPDVLLNWDLQVEPPRRRPRRHSDTLQTKRGHDAMSETLSVTFADLLPKEVEGLGDQIKAHVGDQPGAIAWPLLEDQALQGLRTALSHIDLWEQLAQAWVTLGVVRSYRDPDKVPRRQHGDPLARQASPDHEGDARPAAHGRRLEAPPLKLGYAVTAALDSASLSIRDGALVGAQPGDCATTVTLSCGVVPLHEPWTLAKLELPGHLTFSPGWKIP